MWASQMPRCLCMVVPGLFSFSFGIQFDVGDILRLLYGYGIS